MARKILGAGLSQSIDANQDVHLKGVIVTAAGAAVTVDIKGNGSSELKINAAAGDSETYYSMGGTTGVHLQAPVTADVVGAGAFVRLDY